MESDSDSGEFMFGTTKEASLSSNPGALTAMSHRYLPSIESRSSLSASRDGASEVADTNDILEIYDQIFDEYLNGSDGNVSLDEWYTGLKKLQVDLSDIEKTHLFQILNHDNDENYLSREQWSRFLTMKWDAGELQVYQAVIETRITELFSAHVIHEDTDPSAAALLKRQMTRAIISQTQEAQKEIRKEEEWLEDLHRRARDERFGVKGNALSWDAFEVAHWLERLGLSMYMKSFKNRAVDGSLLLRDVNETVLFELGVDRFHMNKVMREINVLRMQCGLLYEVQHSVHVCDVSPDYSLRQAQERLQGTLGDLQRELEMKSREMEEIRTTLQSEVNRLQLELETKQQTVRDFDVGDEATESGSASQALSWTPRQVVSWMKSINCGTYADAFLESDIDGQILLHDMTRDILSQDLHVRTLHIAKIQREISKLRAVNSMNDWEICVGEHIRLGDVNKRSRNDPLRVRITELSAMNEELNRQVESQDEDISALQFKLDEEVIRSRSLSKALKKKERDETEYKSSEVDHLSLEELETSRGISPKPAFSDIGGYHSGGRLPPFMDADSNMVQRIRNPKTLQRIVGTAYQTIHKQELVIRKQLNTLKSQRRTIEIQQETMIQQEELVARQKKRIHKLDRKLNGRRRHRNNARRDSVLLVPGEASSMISEVSTVSTTLNQLVTKGWEFLTGDTPSQTVR